MNDQELADLAERYRRTLRLAVFVSRRFDAATGLSTTQTTILNMLADEGLRMGAIAENLGVRVPSATEQVGRLERAGLVERRADPTDARAVVVHRTAAGDDAAADANRRRTARMVAAFSGLDPDELEALRAALPVMDKINERLHTLSNLKENIV
ncbi:MarR family transcriptional regulator [Sinomonas sp. ASV322]|uniref:MarR family winged helix-turn-helix transcriptional regulator n=1 Tax=Sinomonas sp. ASV322 TaxID=3041920 RepID=UPI0027DDB605|nr:MarR family transcriptional regulator [Sinomonas sp. ASV322]MDQ4501733.1 MarR family transcriptional regulator [Sinomonas sp. ASV322]